VAGGREALYPFQQDGVDAIKAFPGHVLLADPPGAGKSGQAIIACEELGAKNILVVCPASLRLNWEREFSFWTREAYRTLVWLSGTNGLERAPKDSDLVGSVQIYSYDLATKNGVPFVSRDDPFFDVIIFDEAHYLRSPDADRTKFCLGPLLRRARKVIAITGTPIPNGRAIEAWPLFSALCPEVFSNYQRYLATFCIKRKIEIPRKARDDERTESGRKKRVFRIIHDYNLSKNLDRLGDIARKHFMIRRPEEVVLESVPELLRQVVPVETAYDACKDFTEKDREQIRKYLADEDLDGINFYSHVRRLFATAKYDASLTFIRELLQEEEKLVIFAHHNDIVHALVSDLEAFGVVFIDGDTMPRRRQEVVDLFQQSGGPRVFVGSLLACNTGITLTAAKAAVFVEYDWVPSNNYQAEMRIRRIGQKCITRVFYLEAPGTLDSEILSKVLAKQKSIEVFHGEKRRDGREAEEICDNTTGASEFSVLTGAGHEHDGEEQVHGPLISAKV
jgi:SWI/SNF-related matrix-associated actin-dependent regulator 1 of chromatin subfamily A